MPKVKVKLQDGTIREMETSSPEYRGLYDSGKLAGQNSKTGEFTGRMLPEATVTGQKTEWNKLKEKVIEENKDTGLLGQMTYAPFSIVAGIPQLLATRAITGKYQRPSEALNSKTAVGKIATDMVLDPLVVGGAAVAAGKGLLRKAPQVLSTVGKSLRRPLPPGITNRAELAAERALFSDPDAYRQAKFLAEDMIGADDMRRTPAMRQNFIRNIARNQAISDDALRNFDGEDFHNFNSGVFDEGLFNQVRESRSLPRRIVDKIKPYTSDLLYERRASIPEGPPTSPGPLDTDLDDIARQIRFNLDPDEGEAGQVANLFDRVPGQNKFSVPGSELNQRDLATRIEYTRNLRANRQTVDPVRKLSIELGVPMEEAEKIMQTREQQIASIREMLSRGRHSRELAATNAEMAGMDEHALLREIYAAAEKSTAPYESIGHGLVSRKNPVPRDWLNIEVRPDAPVEHYAHLVQHAPNEFHLNMIMPNRLQAGRTLKYLQDLLPIGGRLKELGTLSGDSFRGLLAQTKNPRFSSSIEGYVPMNDLAVHNPLKVRPNRSYVGSPGYTKPKAREALKEILELTKSYGIKEKPVIRPISREAGVYHINLPNVVLTKKYRIGGLLRQK